VSINLLAPINSLGYGVCGLNIALALERAGAEPALWPLGPVEAPPEAHDALRRMVGRQASYNPKAPSLRLYHQFDLAQHVGKGPHCAMPIFELTRFKPNELHHLKSQDVVFANSRWAGQVLEDNGVPEGNIEYAPLGVDTSVFRFARMMDQDLPGKPTVFLNCRQVGVPEGTRRPPGGLQQGVRADRQRPAGDELPQPVPLGEEPHSVGRGLAKVQRRLDAGLLHVEDGRQNHVTPAGFRPRPTWPTSWRPPTAASSRPGRRAGGWSRPRCWRWASTSS
jgi:hypothetical protein